MDFNQARIFYIYIVQDEQTFVCWRQSMRRKITTEIWAQVKTAHASGIGLREIARNMGISEGTVLAHAKREGWTKGIRSAKALARCENVKPAVSPVEAAAASMQQRGERHIERMAGVSERGVDHIETLDGREILNSADKIDKVDKVARRTFGLNDAQTQIQQTLVDVTILDHR
jgi:hypothetical protein